MSGSARQRLGISVALLAWTAACAAAEVGTVVDVVDGDTIHVALPDGERAVRLLGVDAPEPGRAGRAAEFFGEEASAFTRRLTLGRTVRLEPDAEADAEDRYGRALRWVFLPDGRSLNAVIVAEGFSLAYTRFPNSRLAELRQLERAARENGRGLWNPETMLRLRPEEAAEHTGAIAIVCGLVASTRHAEQAGGQPTFLNLERPYPDQVLTVLIWGTDRVAFEQPEIRYDGERICVTGKIESYRGKPEIEVRDPSQITIDR